MQGSKPSAKVSAFGENHFKEGFSPENLEKHWVGNSSHSAQYPEFTKEQYAQRALELVQSAADGKNILGYKTSDDVIVRYDVKENDYVKGHPQRGIFTMFKPDSKAAYFHSRKLKDGGNKNG